MLSLFSNLIINVFDLFFNFSCFLVNTSDRVIRVYDTKTALKCGMNGEPEPIQKLQDLVNK